MKKFLWEDKTNSGYKTKVLDIDHIKIMEDSNGLCGKSLYEFVINSELTEKWENDEFQLTCVKI